MLVSYFMVGYGANVGIFFNYRKGFSCLFWLIDFLLDSIVIGAGYFFGSEIQVDKDIAGCMLWLSVPLLDEVDDYFFVVKLNLNCFGFYGLFGCVALGYGLLLK